MAATRLPPRSSAVAARETSVGNMTKFAWISRSGVRFGLKETGVVESRCGVQWSVTSGRQRLRRPCSRRLMPMTRWEVEDKIKRGVDIQVGSQR